MAVDIDDLPVYDPITNRDKTSGELSGVWHNAFASLIQTLQEYLTQNGVLLPQLTTVQRDTIRNAVNGQIIYNTTTNTIQAYVNGAWTSIP